MKQYKIWIEVEEYDSTTEEFQDAPGAEPVDIAAGFRSLKKATEFVQAVAEQFADPATLLRWKRDGFYPFERRKK